MSMTTRIASGRTTYDIARTTGLCAQSGLTIPPGTPYMATLCERPADDGFDRLDYSLEAWQSGIRPPRLFSAWKTVMPDPKANTKIFVDDEVLLNLFHRLSEDEQTDRIAYRFVIGLILMRKRRIKLDSTQEKSGRSVWLVRLRGESPETAPLELIDPHLTDDQVRHVSDNLGEILRGDLC